jgi:hypothetical protein
MATQAHIQAQDKSGNWRTYDTTSSNPQYVLKAMQSLQKTYPKYRVRAVDKDGRLIDIL